MKRSEHINELAAALSKAQAEITGALKESSNPYFKSRYADLASCWDAGRVPLTKNGLCVMQGAESDGEGVTLTTMLAHTSGQWVESSLRMVPVKPDPQGVGSCITYARRYALAAMIGLAQIDDDAEAAQGRQDNQRKITAMPDPVVMSAKDRATVDSFVKSFTDTLNADIDETEMSEAIQRLAVEVKEREDTYLEVWRQLDSKQRAAIKKFLGRKAA
jgi:hypothetical protein